jgi:hypothetical protein
MMKVAIQELSWKILQHRPYYLDLAPSDYHLFHSFSNNLRSAEFPSTAMLSSKIGSPISSSVGSKTWRTLGGSRE